MPPKKADYRDGKIYRMFIENDAEKREYVGSTTATLELRFSRHKYDYKRFMKGMGWNCASFPLLAIGDVKMELILAFPCGSRFELERKERETILQRREMCKIININLPARTEDELKEYYQAYKQANKETKAKYNKDYNQANKEAMKARNTVPTQCNHCDKVVQIRGMSHHKKTAYCINYKK